MVLRTVTENVPVFVFLFISKSYRSRIAVCINSFEWCGLDGATLRHADWHGVEVVLDPSVIFDFRKIYENIKFQRKKQKNVDRKKIFYDFFSPFLFIFIKYVYVAFQQAIGHLLTRILIIWFCRLKITGFFENHRNFQFSNKKTDLATHFWRSIVPL